MRISDWSSDVCSSDLDGDVGAEAAVDLEQGVGESLADRLDRLEDRLQQGVALLVGHDADLEGIDEHDALLHPDLRGGDVEAQGSDEVFQRLELLEALEIGRAHV